MIPGLYGRDAHSVHIAKEIYTRSDRWRMYELSIQFQRIRDKKIMAQVAALSRLLAKMDDRFLDAKDRQ
jgi:hypothetical protein